MGHMITPRQQEGLSDRRLMLTPSGGSVQRPMVGYLKLICRFLSIDVVCYIVSAGTYHFAARRPSAWEVIDW